MVKRTMNVANTRGCYPQPFISSSSSKSIRRVETLGEPQPGEDKTGQQTTFSKLQVLIYWAKRDVALMTTLRSNKGRFPPDINAPPQASCGTRLLEGFGVSSLSTGNVAENGSWKQRADAENADRSEPKQHYRPATIWAGRRDPESPTSYTDSPRRRHDICFHFLDIALHSTSRGSGADIWREWSTEMILNQFFLQKRYPEKLEDHFTEASLRESSHIWLTMEHPSLDNADFFQT